MQARTGEPEASIRRIFAPWSVLVPATFSEAFVEEGPYWHGWDEDRSISLSGFVLTEGSRLVPAAEIAAQFPPPLGMQVDELPTDLLGWGAATSADPSSRASRALSGLLAADGRVLVVTITSDDEAWARRVWLSIRHDPDAPSVVQAHAGDTYV